MSQHKKIPVNPEVNASNGLCLIRIETIKAVGAMIHQGKYKPAANANIAVRSIEMVNFILIALRFAKTHFVPDPAAVIFTAPHKP